MIDGSVRPGLVVAAAVAAVAWLAEAGADAVGWTSASVVFLAIVGGMAVRAAAGAPHAWEPGVSLAAGPLLRAAIVVLGLRVSLGEVVAVGIDGLVVIVVAIAAAMLATWVLARSTGIGVRLAVLLGIGTAICGNSAIAAAAPTVRASDEEVSFASLVITTAGTLVMLALPAIGAVLGLGADGIGLAAGAGVHDSAQAIAAGFAAGPEAGEVATVVKLTRTVFLVPAIVVLGIAWSRGHGAGRGPRRPAVPVFVAGFVVATAARTAGDAWLAPADWWAAVVEAAATLSLLMLAVAMAGVGLGADVGGWRRAGPAAAIVGGASALAVTVAVVAVVAVVA